MPSSLASALLGHPVVYNLLQWTLGAVKVRYMCVDYLAASPGDRVLDIGCGTAYYLDRMPRCDYHGFDTDPRYIAYARQHFGDRGRFHDVPYSEETRQGLPPFDRVMLMGLLHHLDETESHSLLDLVARSLAPDARVLSLDTVLFQGQSRLSHWLARHDRGAFVRTPEEFVDMARRHFWNVKQRILGDTLRVPSAHLLMAMSEPKL